MRQLHALLDVRTTWHNRVIVESRVGGVIVLFDMLHVDRLAYTLRLIEIAGVVEDLRVLTDELLISLEVECVDLIEPNQSSEQFDIGESNFITTEESRFREIGLQSIQMSEKILNSQIISLLGLGEPTPVPSIIDMREYPVID